jgi:hypothetical protein
MKLNTVEGVAMKPTGSRPTSSPTNCALSDCDPPPLKALALGLGFVLIKPAALGPLSEPLAG